MFSIYVVLLWGVAWARRNVMLACVVYTHRHGAADTDSTPDTLKYLLLLVY